MILLASLRARMAAILALAILPLFILSLQVNLEARKQALEQAEGQIRRMAHTVNAEEQQVVGYTHQILQIMANANDLERLDSPDCDGLARRLLGTQPLFNNFGAALPSGRIVCSGRPMGEAPVDVSERTWFVEAMGNRRFTQGSKVVGKISGKTGVVFGLPILTPRGELRGAVFANVSLAWFERLLSGLNLPPGWEAGILDEEANLIVSNPGSSSGISRVSTQTHWQQLIQGGAPEQLLHITGPDQTERLTLLAPLDSTRGGIWFYISAPKAEVLDPVERTFRLQLLIFLLVALGAGALGFWVTDRNILAWTRKLGHMARRVGQGELDARIQEAQGITELAELERGFNQMAANLAARQQKEREDAQHIAELNRLYSLLSAVNQCIVSAKSRRELLREVCLIALEKGGFSLAWIGFVDGDNQELTPVMQAGQTDFLRQGERPEGPSPAATAYHSGRLAVVDDIHNNPPSTWRDRALSSGFRAAVGVPLSQRGQVVGVLVLYAPQPGVFDSAELHLLEEVGGDISYALDRLDTEAARQVAEARLARLNEELELRVEQRTAELLTANQDLEAFSYSVSHDLRAPLRALSGYSRLLQLDHGERLDEEGQHYVSRIAQASEHMNHLIDDLLRYSRLGRRGVKIVPVQLDSLLQHILSTRQARIQESQAQIHSTHLPDVESDATLLEQILANLIDNALTYHAPEQPPVLDIRAWITPEGWQLQISDQGIGIAPEHQDKVFAVFQRLHPDETYPGTGIGLAIVRKAVQHLGGSIQLQSAPGQGSTFTLSFPTTPPSL